MRLFIAIQLSDDIRNSLSAVQTYMRDHGVRGNYAKIENLHLTLAFIGEYSDPDLVLEVIRSVPFVPFQMRIEGFGCFGNLYWCGIGENDDLLTYVKRLRRALAGNGIPFDRKKFSPHITLIRRAEYDRRRGFPGVAVPDVSMQVLGIFADALRPDKERDGLHRGGRLGYCTWTGMNEANRIYHDTESKAGMPWPHGELWGLGDQGTIAVLMEELERVSYEIIQAPTILADMTYSFENQNRPIRVYRSVDPRLVLEDFFAKLAINFG